MDFYEDDTDNEVLDFTKVHPSNPQTVPDGGVYTCELEVGKLTRSGQKMTARFPLKGWVVLGIDKGCVIEDNFFLTENKRTFERLQAAVKALTGITIDSRITAGEIRQLLNGRIANITVEGIEEFTTQRGMTIRRTKVAWADGYTLPSAEELEALKAQGVRLQADGKANAVNGEAGTANGANGESDQDLDAIFGHGATDETLSADAEPLQLCRLCRINQHWHELNANNCPCRNAKHPKGEELPF